MEKLLLKPEEAAEALGVGRSKLYELISAGVIDSVRIGSSRRVPVVALEEFVVRLQSGTPLLGANGHARRDPLDDARGD